MTTDVASHETGAANAAANVLQFAQGTKPPQCVKVLGAFVSVVAQHEGEELRRIVDKLVGSEDSKAVSGMVGEVSIYLESRGLSMNPPGVVTAGLRSQGVAGRAPVPDAALGGHYQSACNTVKNMLLAFVVRDVQVNSHVVRGAEMLAASIVQSACTVVAQACRFSKLQVANLLAVLTHGWNSIPLYNYALSLDVNIRCEKPAPVAADAADPAAVAAGGGGGVAARGPKTPAKAPRARKPSKADAVAAGGVAAAAAAATIAGDGGDKAAMGVAAGTPSAEAGDKSDVADGDGDIDMASAMGANTAASAGDSGGGAGAGSSPATHPVSTKSKREGDKSEKSGKHRSEGRGRKNVSASRSPSPVRKSEHASTPVTYAAPTVGSDGIAEDEGLVGLLDLGEGNE